MRAKVVLLCLAAVGARDVFAPSITRADDAPAAHVDADTRERSRAAFRRGVAQLRAQDWASARQSFEAAWSLYPHPSILLNLGIARLRTDDPVRAEQDFVRFLSEDFGASPEELAGAREALAETRAKLGTLRVVAGPPSARVQVDGKVVEAVRRADPAGGASDVVVAEVRTKPGKHGISVAAEGFRPAQREVDVVARGEVSVTFTLTPEEAASKKVTAEEPATRAIVGWSLVGLAGVALTTSVVTGVRAMSLADDYADPTSPAFQSADVRSEGVTFRTSADVALGVGLLAGAAAVVLLLTDLGKSSAADVGRSGSAPRSVTRFGAPVLHW